MTENDDGDHDRARGGAHGRDSPGHPDVDAPDLASVPPELAEVLESAAKLQVSVPDAVLVGGTVSALYAAHRVSFDHDHVLQLADRYEAVLEAVEATDGWATSVRASKPPMTIMGKLGGIEAGLRQLRRTAPLETQRLILPGRQSVRIPTRDEALRVKAYLIVQRNQVRDYLDVAAMADVMGLARAAKVLRSMGDFYDDRSHDRESVVSELVIRLARPAPRDTRALDDLPHYKRLRKRWQRWEDVTAVCADLAQAILGGAEPA